MHEASSSQFKENGGVKLCPPPPFLPPTPKPSHFSSCLTANQTQVYMREETFAGIF